MQTQFIDAYERAAENPESFEIPYHEKDAALADIIPGDFVKVGVELLENGTTITGERFWLKVKEVSDGKIVGMVDDYLFLTSEHDYNYGDEITIEPRHVLDHVCDCIGKEGA